MKKSLLIAALAALVTFSAAESNAQTIVTTADGTWGADSFILASTADTNYGTAEVVYLRRSVSNNALNARAYWRFDLTTWNGGTITDSSLDFAFVTSALAAGNYNILLYGLNNSSSGEENWGETTIAWNNAPANLGGNSVPTGSGSNQASYIGALPFTIASGSPAAGSILTFTNSMSATSDALINFLNADTNDRVTFIGMLDAVVTSGGITQLGTKENTLYDAPSLTVVPEPSTYALLGIGALVVAFLRRRSA